MEKTFIISLLIFIKSTACYSQFTDIQHMDFSEKNIAPPTYTYGYKAVCDSLYSLIKYYKIQPDSLYTYVATFTIKVKRNGKIMYHIHSSEASDVFSRLVDTLPVWVRKINNWHSAFKTDSNKKINNYNLHFAIDLNSKIFITISDRNQLSDLYRISYPL